MQEIKLNNIDYKLIKNIKDGYDLEELTKRYTDYFESFDYVVGDWSYGKLRLKGFNKKTNSNFNKINDEKNIAEYIEKNCAYGCKWFEIEKINN